MALSKQENENCTKQFGLHENDTGSAAVQITALTENIRCLTKHLQENRHDFASKRGLLVMISRRRKLLKYIARKDVAKYNDVIERLGLKRIK